MVQTRAGGLKVRDANLARDPDHYKKIGKLGGKAKFPGKGFAANPELARIAGARGGTISRRKKSV